MDASMKLEIGFREYDDVTLCTVLFLAQGLGAGFTSCIDRAALPAVLHGVIEFFSFVVSPCLQDDHSDDGDQADDKGEQQE